MPLKETLPLILTFSRIETSITAHILPFYFQEFYFLDVAVYRYAFAFCIGQPAVFTGKFWP